MEGRVVTGTGWTYQQLGETELLDVISLTKSWRQNPPTHELVAAFMGYQAPREEEEMEQIAQSTDNIPLEKGRMGTISRSQLPRHVQDLLRSQIEGRIPNPEKIAVAQ